MINNKELNRKRKSSDNCSELPGGKVLRSNDTNTEAPVNSLCFFCDKPEGKIHMYKHWHKASTFHVHNNVTEAAKTLNDTLLLGKLSAGDMMAQDAYYHGSCLTTLYKKAANTKRIETKNAKDEQSYGIAFAELCSHIEEKRLSSEISPVFRLRDLVQIYQKRLAQLGVEELNRVHSTRLKYRIQSHFTDMDSFNEGKNVILAFRDDIGAVLKNACNRDFDDEGIILAKAAQIVRRDILQMESSVFSGTFEDQCQQDAVPTSLTTLITMVLGGPNIETQSQNLVEMQSVLSIAQLIQYNSTVRRRIGSTASYHTKSREPPLPV